MKLPTPDTRDGWFAGIALSVCFFLLYYLFAYPRLEEVYNRTFWPGDGRSTQDALIIKIRIPRYLASFVEREVLVSVENTSPDEMEVALSVSATATNSSVPSYVIIRSPEAIRAAESGDDGSNVITFGKLPPHATFTRSLLIKVRDGHPGDQIDFEFLLRTKKSEGEGWVSRPLTPTGPSSASIDPPAAFLQSVAKTVLLPPWSNGFLPALAFLSAASLEHRLRRGRRETDLSRIRRLFTTQPAHRLPSRIKAFLLEIQLLHLSGRSWAALVLMGLGILSLVSVAMYFGLWLLDAIPSWWGIVGIGLVAVFCILFVMIIESVRAMTDNPPETGFVPPDLIERIRHTTQARLAKELNAPNNPQSELQLFILQRANRALPEFGEFYALLQKPSGQHQIILKSSVQETCSTELQKLTGKPETPKVFDGLLDLQQARLPEIIKFKDGETLIKALVTLRSPEAKQALIKKLRAKNPPADHRRLIQIIRQTLKDVRP